MVPSLSRRTALQLAGGSLLGVSAGCAVFEDSSPAEVTITRAAVSNEVERELDVALHLIDDDETAYWRTVRVDAFDPDTATAGGADFDELPEAAGEYTAHARLVGVQEAEPARWDVLAAAREQSASCAEIHLDVSRIGPRDGEHPSVTFLSTGDERYWQCPSVESG